MGLIILFLIISLLIYKSRNYDTISKRILLIYTAFWGTVIVLASIGIYDYNKPSSSTLIMMVVHVVAFIIGFSFIRISKYNFNNFSLESLDVKLQKLTSNKLFISIISLLTLYVISLVLRFFSLLGTMNMSELRTDFYESGIYGSLFAAINGPILSPINLLLIPVFSWMCLKRRNWFCLIQAIYLLGYASLGGGRFGYLRILLGIIFVVFCLYLNAKNKRKRIIQLLVSLTIFIIMIGVTTTLRMSDYVDSKDGIKGVAKVTTEAVVSYAVAPIIAFDYALNNDYVNRIGGYKYGALTGSAPELFIYIILNKIGIKYEKALDSLVEIKQNEYINIGDEEYWNALYTSLLYYYLDFGWFGIFFFPFLFGMLTRWILKKLFQTNSICIYIILTYIFHEIVRAVTDFTFIDVYTFLFMSILLVIGRQKIHF